MMELVKPLIFCVFYMATVICSSAILKVINKGNGNTGAIFFLSFFIGWAIVGLFVAERIFHFFVLMIDFLVHKIQAWQTK